MIIVKEALDYISQQVKDYGSELIPLDQATGRILSIDLVADRDFPPFDRVTMDGIGIDYSAYKAGKRSFKIEGIAAAGAPFQTLKNYSNCLEVMTGAGMPKGADTVFRYEDLEISANNVASLHEGVIVKEKQNVHFQGSDHKAKAILLAKGTLLRPSDIGIAASIGYAEITVRKLPKTAIISTGDELVEIDKTPLPHQIRKSNVYTIKSRLEHYGIDASLYHLADEKEAIRSELKTINDSYELVILSGGVSKGKFDYIPEILAELGVKKDFHKVKQRPGKPFWFGNTSDTVIFALPGNPVSSFVCTKKYIENWLCASIGKKRFVAYGKLASDVTFKPDLHYFMEVKLEYGSDAIILAHPMKGNGSGDFINLKRVEAFMELPMGKTDFKAGEVYPLVLFDR